METIRAWLHSSLIDIKSETPAKLYRKYTSWLQKRNVDITPASYSLFRTTIQNINLIEQEDSEPITLETPKPTVVIEPEIKPIETEEVIEMSESLVEEEESNEDIDEEEIFQQIENYTRSVANPESRDYAFIVSGDPGLGKTVSVTKILEEVLGKESSARQFIDVDETNEYILDDSDEEIEEGLEWKEGPTRITAAQLYIFLYRENGKVLLFDDADVLIEDSNNFDILKKVLDSKKSRSVGYGSKPIILKKASTAGKDVIIPNEFEFTGRIIVVTNKPFHKINSAIKSRALVVEVNLSAEQCLKRVKRLLPHLLKDDPRATMEVKEEILEYLLSISNLFKKIDLRTMEQSIEEYFRSPGNWKELVKRSIILKTKESK